MDIVATVVFLCTVGIVFLFVTTSGSKKSHEAAIAKTIEAVDVIVDGRRYLGSKARVVATYQGLSSGRIGQEVVVSQLCCTEGGRWFTLTFKTENGSPVSGSVSVKPAGIDCAKAILATRPDLYEKEFGAAEIA